MRLDYIFVMIWIILILTLCVFVVRGHPAEISLGFGQDIPYESWQSKSLECSVIQLELSDEFKSPWYGSVILDKMQGKVNLSTSNGIAISTRLGIQKRLFGSVYGSLFGGFGVLLACLPEIGDSGVVGHFGAGVKYNMTKFTFGLECAHMSDPLQSHDNGWNWFLFTIGRKL